MPPTHGTAETDFRNRVEGLYLALSGRGLMVSPADAATIAAWERDAIPLELVERTVRRLLGPLPEGRRLPPLRYCDAAVREAWDRRSQGMVVPEDSAGAGARRTREIPSEQTRTSSSLQGPTRPGQDSVAATATSAARALQHAGKKLPGSHALRRAYEEGAQHLVRLARRASTGEVEPMEGYRELARVDARLCRAFLGWLPSPERQRLRADAAADAHRRDRGRSSPTALAQLRRELLARALEERGLCRVLGAPGDRSPRRNPQ